MNHWIAHLAHGGLITSMLVLAASCGGGQRGQGAKGPVVSAEDQATIGPEGGELAVGDSRLVVPAGALDAEETFSIRQHDGVSIEGWTLVSPVFEIEPHGTTFASPATLTISAGAAGARLLRADDMGSDFAPIEAEVGVGETRAELTGLSAFTVAEAALDGDPPQSSSFEIDGVTYSSDPVTLGEIAGFGYAFEEAAGVSDGGPGDEPGRVWFGDVACVTFRVDGTGIVDTLGGREDDHSDLPSVQISHNPPNGAALPSRGGQLPGTDISLSTLPAPDSDRTDSLWTFRWGVKLDDNGAVDDSGDMHEYYLLFDDEEAPFDSGEIRWRVDGGPFLTTLISSDLSEEYDADHHLCYFRETRVNEVDGNGLNCVERDVTAGTKGEAVMHVCYDKGMLQGDFSIATKSGQTLVSGEWKDHRPTGKWSFFDENGQEERRGEFDAEGVRFGAWEDYEDGFLSRTCTVGGELVETPFGFHEELDGPYEAYYPTADEQVRESGRYESGFRSGEWLFYEEDGALERTEVFDVSNQVGTGFSNCTTLDSGEEHCVEKTRSARTQKTLYDWGECNPGNNVMRVIVYDDEEAFESETCFELQGTPEMPQRGDTVECGSDCGI